MHTKLTALFVPIDAVGHVNAAIGQAEVLILAGHRVVFAVSDQWRGRLTKYGIEEVLLHYDTYDNDKDPAREWADRLQENGVIKKDSTAIDNLINMMNLMPYMIENAKILDTLLEGLIPKIKPDVILVDHGLELTSVVKSGIPWVLVNSCNPLVHFDYPELPPPLSGLPAIGHRDEWKAFRVQAEKVGQPIRDMINKYLISKGVPPINDNKFVMYINNSKYLNIYGYPLELDYQDMRPLPPKWYRFDNLKRTEKGQPFDIPVSLRDRPGKLIYFSLGSMGSVDVKNMKRLVTILSKSKHRFIVSKGPKHAEYELPDNMWGAATVPQIQVLSLVDLVITHGGNNTTTETFSFGKPMIVMPLLADQWDNAQRVHEKGFGIRLDAYKCSESELLTAIDKLLNDKKLIENLKTISKRIQSDNSIAKLPELIEKLVNKHDINNN
ncbi:unnamed protein product [Oppiella nova]|uniref:UDP-glycosyltransferase n=1 Tax=Oppiella nova TaxID=334625 RepID=A0A7R9QHW3_9ACAR|nr:unnamed protein product [Oppiella nova]CAG2166276.1 unnamed protein product [Oppiella nova]